MSAIPRVEPPRWLWLYFPLLALLGERAAFIRDYTRFDMVYTEAGLVERGTALVLALGVITGIAILRHRTRLPARWIRAWVGLVTLASVYACGEEIAWGQHIFGWETPAWWWAVNKYGETGLTGIDYRLEEASRDVVWLFLVAWLFVVAGIVCKVLQRVESWFWPPYICLPSALLAVVMRVPEALLRLGVDPVIYWAGWDEMEELYLAMFLFLYLLSLWYRLGMEGGGSGGHLPEVARAHDGRHK